jgi:hypothetical protein
MGGKANTRQGSASDVGTSSANGQAPLFSLLLDGMSFEAWAVVRWEARAARGTWALAFRWEAGRKQRNPAADPRGGK